MGSGVVGQGGVCGRQSSKSTESAHPPNAAVRGVVAITGAEHNTDVFTAIALPLLALYSRCSKKGGSSNF